MATVKKVKKAAMGVTTTTETTRPKATTDSTGFFKKEVRKAGKNLADAYSVSYPAVSSASNKLATANKNLKRQALKGKAGYDANGNPIKKDKKGGVVKSKMKMGGKMAKQAAIAIAMKKAGKAPKKMMQYGGAAASMKPTMNMGGSLKPVDKAKNPGLSKLPTPVRNKMGYQKMGGKTTTSSMMKMGGKMTKKCMTGCK